MSLALIVKGYEQALFQREVIRYATAELLDDGAVKLTELRDSKLPPGEFRPAPSPAGVVRRVEDQYAIEGPLPEGATGVVLPPDPDPKAPPPDPEQAAREAVIRQAVTDQFAIQVATANAARDDSVRSLGTAVADHTAELAQRDALVFSLRQEIAQLTAERDAAVATLGQIAAISGSMLARLVPDEAEAEPAVRP